LPHFSNTLLSDEELFWKVRGLFSLFGRTASVLERESVFSSLLSELILRHGGGPPIPCGVGPRRTEIEKVCEFIRMNYGETLSLEQLGRMGALSPFHFQRTFVEEKGISPHEYLVHFRIDKARELLLKGRSIVEVALETGFVDQNHFTRFFQRLVGITPGRYRTAACSLQTEGPVQKV
jgi:transcriptional regulator GlxA family with amidase domain